MEHKEYKYYSTMRPICKWTYPENGLVLFHNYDEPRYIGEIVHDAYGHLIYDHELSIEEAFEYELTPESYEIALTVAEIRFLRKKMLSLAGTKENNIARGVYKKLMPKERSSKK